MAYNYNNMTATAREVVKYFKNKGKSAVVKVSRYNSVIKAVEVDDKLVDVEAFLNSVSFPGNVSEISPSDQKSISGTYISKLVNITKDVRGTSLKAGESFFILNTHTEKGSIKSKALTPGALGLDKQVYNNLSSFDGKVITSINNLKFSNDIKDVLTELYSGVASYRNKSNLIPYTNNARLALTKIKPMDKQAIGKDFGEILSLRWYITQHSDSVSRFGFETGSNAALIDFYFFKKIDKNNELKIEVSAKYQEGGAPSIKALIKQIDIVYKTPGSKEKPVLDILNILGSSGETTSEKILKIAKTLDLPGYRFLANKIKNNLNIRDIDDYIRSIALQHSTLLDRKEEFLSQFEPYYQTIGKNVTEDSLNVIFSTDKFPKYSSSVIAPLGYMLVDYMNKNPEYSNVLNNLSRSLKVEQVYLNLTPSGLSFTNKIFKDASFKFEYGANAKNADNTGIKFSMRRA